SGSLIMMVPSGGQMKVRSVIASLAIGLLLTPGCGQQEEGPADPSTKAPPNPAPRADPGRTVGPKVPRPSDISNVEKDLRKDLTSPVITPAAPTPPAPPVPRPDRAKPGQP